MSYADVNNSGELDYSGNEDADFKTFFLEFITVALSK